MKTYITVLALAASHVSALSIPRSSYPFSQLVAFGDELSDNGNGSYAHGITGDPANVYGSGTWTNGPVAVSYLADMLGVPLIDYAFGGCCGGGTYGAVLDNKYTDGAAEINGKPVPALVDQVNNYTSYPPGDIKNALQFIWIGENDLSAHTDAFWEGDPRNAEFAKQYATRVTAQAELLVGKGAPYVFVANIYPKHLAPVLGTYLCPDKSCIAAWGSIISKANAALQQSLSTSKYASKFIYYDVFSQMERLMINKMEIGLTERLDVFCDGGVGNKWDQCIRGSYVWEGAQTFYWMNYIQPTTVVHKMIAQDMKTTIDKFFGV